MNDKILIIGHGRELLYAKRGPEIDAFPGKLVRFSEYVINGYEERVGTRENFYFIAGYSKYIYDNLLFRNHDRTYIYCTEAQPNNAKWVQNIINANERNINIILPWDIVCKGRDEVTGNGRYLTSGVMAIYYFLSIEYEVYIIGFDFMQLGQEYFKTGTEPISCVCHDYIAEKKWVENLLKEGKIRKF